MSEPLWNPPPPPGGFGGEVPPPPAAVPLPWEDRERLGFGTALIETVKLFVVAPAAAFARTRPSGDYGSPLLYAVVVGWVVAIFAQLWNALFQGMWLSILPLPPEMRGAMLAQAGSPWVGFAIGVVLAPIFVLIGLFIGSGIIHLFLMLVGGTANSSAGFEGTLRSVAYASTSSIAQVVPVIGLLVAVVWNIVLEIEGLAALHRTSKGKAAAAVLLPIGLCCVCAVVLAVAFGAAIMAAFGAAAGR